MNKIIQWIISNSNIENGSSIRYSGSGYSNCSGDGCGDGYYYTCDGPVTCYGCGRGSGFGEGTNKCSGAGKCYETSNCGEGKGYING